MEKRCTVSGRIFAVEPRDLEFYSKVSPYICGKKYELAPPTLSPAERQRRRLAQRQERFLYRTASAVNGKPLISCYSPDKPLKVIDKSSWREEDNFQFGREFDFNRPFFDQFYALLLETYKPNLIQAGRMENSDFAHFCSNLRNCYWVFDMGDSEDCRYGVWMGSSKDCADGLFMARCELCYECVCCNNCYNVFFSTHAKSCSFSSHLWDCIGCNHCLGCANLRNKEYCVFNEHVGKSKFETLWADIFSGSHSTLETFHERYAAFLKRQPRRPSVQIQCAGSSGDILAQCENVTDSFNVQQAKDCRFCYDSWILHDCYDIGTYGENMEFCYELSGSGGVLNTCGMSNCLFSAYLYFGGHNVLYSYNCHNQCQDIFGCADLLRAKHCVLNKQYSKEDYERLVPRIIEHMRRTGEWGEFFPASHSLFGYNESLAQEYYPLSRQEALNRGYRWSDYQTPPPSVKANVAAASLPDRFNSDSAGALLDCAVECEFSKKLFRYVKPELDFYLKHRLPLPRVHPEERHRRRNDRLNPREIWKRNCAKTREEIETSYPPACGLEVLSERAYEAETY